MISYCQWKNRKTDICSCPGECMWGWLKVHEDLGKQVFCNRKNTLSLEDSDSIDLCTHPNAEPDDDDPV